MPDETEWTLQDADELRTAVGRFVRAGRRESQLPQAQANVLGALDRGGPVTISELAGELRVRHQSARETVAVLSRQELISVTRSDDDARKVICTITAAGRSCLDADREARSAWIVAQTRHLTLAQRRAARGIAEILARLSEDASTG